MEIREPFLHPIRLRIISATLDGRPFTARDLTSWLPDVSVATLYRQLAILVGAKMIEIVAEERIRGGVQRTYQLTSRRPLLTAEDTSALTPGEHQDLLSRLATAMAAEFSRFASEPDADLAAASYRQFALWLTEDERADLLRELEDVVSRYAANAPEQGRRNHLATLVVFPRGATANGS